ncbi:MAG: tetratricopeptide repeat protein, partial [Chitinophagales bacterium]
MFAIRMLLGLMLFALLQSNATQANSPLHINITDRKQEAADLGSEAMRLITEEKSYDQAIALLQKSQQLDPKNIVYPFEMAYAYYAQAQYGKTVKLLRKLVKHPQATPNYYRLLGNAYDMLADDNAAINIYKKGLNRFDNAGKIYAELGWMYLKADKKDLAINQWEKGIEKAPKEAANYYWAAKMYCHSSEPLWGILYGELFLHLAPKSDRALEISKVLYDTYQKRVLLNSDQSGTVSMSNKGRQIILFNLMNQEEVQSFQIAYELALSDIRLQLNEKTKLSFSQINKIRNYFLANWTSAEGAKNYPIVVFDWQQEVTKAGYAEAYNYWLVRAGNFKEFEFWRKENIYYYQSFLEWLDRYKM